MKADLDATARALVAKGKGILAADESSGTIKKRLASRGASGISSSASGRGSSIRSAHGWPKRVSRRSYRS